MTKLEKAFPQLFAKVSTDGPADAAALARQLSAAGMTAAAWVVEGLAESLAEAEDFESDLDAAGEEISALEGELDALRAELASVLDGLEEARAW